MLALGARGLVNAQFIVRDDGVYLIEVNPRAQPDRAVPLQGDRRADGRRSPSASRSAPRSRSSAGAAACCRRPDFVAVKAPAFSTAKLRGVDPSVGPGMQSTGEVIGIDMDPRVALAKALLGAALVPPRPGVDGALALLSIADRDKGSCLGSRRRWPRPATGWPRPPGRARRSRPPGSRRSPVAKLGEAAGRGDGRDRHPRAHRPRRRPPGRQHADAALGRRSGTRRRSGWPRPPEGILCLTAMETAIAAAEALDPAIAERLVERALARRMGAARASPVRA